MDVQTGKGISLAIFFLVTFVPGIGVVALFSRSQVRLTSGTGKTVLSLLNCIAGGVFLSTCLLSLLTEGLEQFEHFKEEAGFHSDYPFFHLGVGVGFFLVAYVERLAFCFSLSHLVGPEGGGPGSAEECVGMETVGNSIARIADEEVRRKEEEGKEGERREEGDGKRKGEAGCDSITMSAGHVQTVKETAEQHSLTVSHGQDPHGGDDPGGDEQVPAGGPPRIRAIIFLLALSFHTIFDGLAVGLQDSQGDVWTMTGAIVLHKVVMVLSLALELCKSQPGRPWRVVYLLFLFSLITPIGVAIGMGVKSGEVDVRRELLAGSVLQSLAAGSVLYVTFFEILGEELGHHGTVLKICVMVLGFAVIAVIKIWDIH